MPLSHTINYLEFTAENLSVVKEFYTKVFQWRFTDYGPEYIAFTDGHMEGGFALGAPSQDGVLTILYTEDLEKTRDTIIAAGGTIDTEIFSFPGGRRFHFRDPAGILLAVWSQ